MDRMLASSVIGVMTAALTWTSASHAGDGRAQQPSSHPESTVANSTPPDSDESRFAFIAERHAEVVVLVRRIVAERQERTFEEATSRHMRLRALMKRLEGERAAKEEAAFEEELRKAIRIRAFMRQIESDRSERTEEGSDEALPKAEASEAPEG